MRYLILITFLYSNLVFSEEEGMPKKVEGCPTLTTIMIEPVLEPDGSVSGVFLDKDNFMKLHQYILCVTEKANEAKK